MPVWTLFLKNRGDDKGFPFVYAANNLEPTFTSMGISKNALLYIFQN